jgi:hypothetical protein
MVKTLITIFILARACDGLTDVSVYTGFETGVDSNRNCNQITYTSHNSLSDLNLIWDNGFPDEVGAICCQRIGSAEECDVVDDVHTDQDYFITGISWDTIDDTTYVWDGTGDFEFYLDTGTGPGEDPYVQLLNIPNKRDYIGRLYNRPWWRYTIELAPEDQFMLPEGDYFVLARPYNPTYYGSSFWLTAVAPPESKSQIYFRSENFGYPTWTPGEQIFGDKYDVNFRLYGEVEGGLLCYYPDPPEEAYTGTRIEVTKCYVNDSDTEATFSGEFVVYFFNHKVAVLKHKDVTVAAHSEKCITYLSPTIPWKAREKTFNVCNEGTVECCFTISVYR